MFVNTFYNILQFMGSAYFTEFFAENSQKKQRRDS
jgi:hypothetical protein